MKLTFVDADVLIAAARGTEPVAAEAFRILDDPDRRFASSAFVKLEVLPKPTHNKRVEEAAFYEEFFAAVTHWADDLNDLMPTAFREACGCGLSAVDALHVAAAAAVGAEELVTAERETSPLHRTTAVHVVSLRRT